MILSEKISSPLLQHAMSAFFNTSKMPPPTGPRSIRMSSNASVLFPIREEGGGIGKMSINDDILDEVDSSPCSSLSSINRLNNIENKSSIENVQRLDLVAERRGTNVNIQLPKNSQLQIDRFSPKSKKHNKSKDKEIISPFRFTADK